MTTATYPELDPNWVLDTLSRLLVEDYADEAVTLAAGRPAMTDTDRLVGTGRALSYLYVLTAGRLGRTYEQQAAMRDAAESEVAK
ncbi:hypothetical protein H4696_008451 [Amycolatopsis lexingtonensis]|uniref:Uncharacterized protein n=1 Tax=Amycolatopsis lexingtonensis TaxID=218822 RepID=A0ABR9IDW4_9PSEU|nr:hypothetical protein [Amycolatopsis lexingtonensis]MBE1501351.1 hypothetical protein [Amycolatopsis lexingtonensis]